METIVCESSVRQLNPPAVTSGIYLETQERGTQAEDSAIRYHRPHRGVECTVQSASIMRILR
jgi:hypothetical protein